MIIYWNDTRAKFHPADLRIRFAGIQAKLSADKTATTASNTTTALN